jgi:GNAT superfamily N-acetyltransferase
MITECAFNDIVPLWRDPEMWGDDEFKPVSSMKFYDGIDYMGGNDMSVYDLDESNPRFFMYDSVGCISTHFVDRTTRLRGLFVQKEHRGQGISEQLLRHALRHCSGYLIWALAGPNSTHVHEKLGFSTATQQFRTMPDGNVSKHKNSYMRYYGR